MAITYINGVSLESITNLSYLGQNYANRLGSYDIGSFADHHSFISDRSPNQPSGYGAHGIVNYGDGKRNTNIRFEIKQKPSTLPGIYTIIQWTGGGTEETRWIGGNIFQDGFQQFVDQAVAPQRAISPTSTVWFQAPGGCSQNDGSCGTVQLTQIQQMRNAGFSSVIDDIITGMKKVAGPTNNIVTYIGGRWQDDIILQNCSSNQLESYVRAEFDVWASMGGIALDDASAWAEDDPVLNIAKSYIKQGTPVWGESFPVDKPYLLDCGLGLVCLESTWLRSDRPTFGFDVNTNAPQGSLLLCELANITAEKALNYLHGKCTLINLDHTEGETITDDPPMKVAGDMSLDEWTKTVSLWPKN